jgi:hypothetical protein
MSETSAGSAPAGAPDLSPRDQNLHWALRQIEDALRDLRFGALTLLVQDGVIVQVERTERRRYRRGGGAGAAAS